MKLAIVGTGYVGLVTGTCFAELGHSVTCVDIDAEKIAALQSGKIPIYEPGLESLVAGNRAEGRLEFTTDLPKAVRNALVIFIAVGTPPRPDGSADLSAVYAVARAIGRSINGYKIVVDKSTVPVGTARRVAALIQEEMEKRAVEYPFDVVSNPEFLREGAAIEDFMKPDRVVIGCDNVRVRVLMEELYSQILQSGKPFLVMSPESAELTKYAANAMLATRISFINEMANLCEEVGANIDEVRLGIGSDSRIGYAFLMPGIGYGGSCFPKDVQALRQTASEVGRPSLILEAVHQANLRQKSVLMSRVTEYYGDNLAEYHFAVWGLAFKAETDDVREAPALTLIESLLAGGARVTAYDPKAMHTTQEALGTREGLEYAASPLSAAEHADGLLVCTDWPLFRNVELTALHKVMRRPVVFDGRNVFQPAWMFAHGFDYFSIGRAPVYGFSQKAEETGSTLAQLPRGN